MSSKDFFVTSIRPPVVYGKGCKGNFPKLVKLSRIIPIFPSYPNIRSMLYIDNLCELVRLAIVNSYSGIIHPQNKEQTSTMEMVELISKNSNHKVFFTRFFNPIISLLKNRFHLINRMFANDYYSRELSNVFDYKYDVVSFEDSIERSI